MKKNMKHFAITSVFLIGVSAASGQSLGDYARTVRKNKPDSASATRHFDNDNLPTNETLSVVGPATAPDGAAAGQGNVANAAQAAASDPAAKAAERKKTEDEWAKKLNEQKEKIDALNHELDQDQREYRLRAAEVYNDAGNRLRDPAQWDKDGAKYKADVEEKQKAVEAARQQLEDLQEEARKTGIAEKEKDADSNNEKTKE
jgi:hypothetical protein